MGDAPNPYMLLDREYRFVWANRAYEKVVMRPYGEFAGRVLFEAFPPPDAATERQLRTSIDRAFDSGETDELALIEYAIRNEAGEMERAVWSATHTPVRRSSGEIAFVLQHTVNITELASLREMRDEIGVMERARSVERRSLDLVKETEQLRSVFEQAPGFVAITTGPEHRFVMANAAYRRLLGFREFIGQTVAEAVPEVVEQGFVSILDKVFTTASPYLGERDKVIFRDEGTNEPRETYLEFIFQPILDEDGEVGGILIQGYDVTEAVRAEGRQRLLINELNHRVKNTLAIVQGLAQQSFGKEPGVRFGTFSARLAALAGAHNLLTEATWESANLRELVYSSLEATAGLNIARCTLVGEPVILSPSLALSLTMIVHELSTNAIKYGALANRDGRVHVAWTVREGTDGRVLELNWEESGGPPVSTPEREGFGTRLIRRGLSGQGSVALEYNAEGLRCRIEARL